MTRRRPDRLHEIHHPQILEQLAAARRVIATNLRAEVRPGSEQYKRAAAVMTAIDDLVEDMTGDRQLLWEKPHGSPRN